MRDFLQLMEEGEKLESSLSQRAKNIANFEEKLDRFIKLIAGVGMSANKRHYLMKEAETTSDFPILFGTVLERQLLAKYQAQPVNYRAYVKTGTQNDFRPANLLGVFGLQSGLAAVAQRGEYKNDKLQDGKVAISLGKFGRQFNLAWESLINDDLGAFADLAERLATAAARTEYREATKLVAASTGPNTALFGAPIVHPIDGQNVTNKVAVLLTAASALDNAVTTMRQYKDADSEPIIVDGFTLVVPPALEIAARKLLSPGSLIGFGGGTNTVQTSTNVIAQQSIDLQINPYLPIVDTAHGNEAWYLFAKNVPSVQLNFLRGHEAPEIVQRMSNKVSLGGGAVAQTEGDFESDSMAWRVRHIMGGVQIDPRGAYASSGT